MDFTTLLNKFLWANPPFCGFPDVENIKLSSLCYLKLISRFLFQRNSIRISYRTWTISRAGQSEITILLSYYQLVAGSVVCVTNLIRFYHSRLLQQTQLGGNHEVTHMSLNDQHNTWLFVNSQIYGDEVDWPL